MSNNKPLTFKKGKIPRNELELPTLHFVVVDQWIKVIGEKALLAWLQMYSWCKRDEEDSDVNLWEQAKIPTSYNKVIKRLGVGKDTFYNKILKPLWNVGLIDIEEYEDSENKGTKPMNIIVYKYPQNNKTLAHQEIKMIRDYDKDYHSNAKTFAKKGGRPRLNKGGSEREPGGVLKENHPPFQNRSRGGSEREPNNILNSNSNSLNSINNTPNNINNNLNLSSSSRETRTKSEKSIKTNEEEEVIKLCNENFVYDFLGEYLSEKGIEKDTIVKTILECNKRNLHTFTIYEIEKQYNFMMDKIQYGERIYNFPVFFANGLKDVIEQSRSNKIYQEDKIREYELAMQRKKENQIIYYNWLEEN